MFKHHLKTAWRSFSRNTTFSLIKIAGLSIGLTVCMLIFLYIKDDLSYDRFHEKEGQLYRVVQEMKQGDDPSRKMGITVTHLGPAFAKGIPEISGFVRTNIAPVTIRHNNEVFIENPLFADSTFFSEFSFKLLTGNRATVLNDIHSIVLSEDYAKKYFGTVDASGKTLEVKLNGEFEVFTIAGIAENSPQNSTIRFDILLPFSAYLKSNPPGNDWIGGSVNTFLVLNKQADIKVAEQKMQKLYNARTKEQIANIKKEYGITAKITLGLEPISDIHLGSFGQDNGLESGSSITYSYILGCIGIFILIVACINFINLAIAQSLKRSKEMGIRKVVGGTRKQLIRQFLTESLFVSSVSFIIAIVLAFSLLPLFNAMANKHMNFSYLADYKLYIGYFFLLLLTSFIAGFYPSLVLSSFKPVKVLYNRQKLMGKNYFTRGLVVLQFTLAIFFVVCAIAIYTQMNFIYNKDLGYETKNLLRIDMPFGETSELFKTFRNELANNPSVTGMAGRNRGGTITLAKASGKDIEVDYSKINETFFSVLKIPLKTGRNFSPDFPSDATQSAIVNETFVSQAGWKDPVGQSVSVGEGHKAFTIIGVVRDYHFRSLKQKITAQLFSMDSSMNYGQTWVKIKPTDLPKTVSSIQQTFKKISPLFPFSYQFMTDNTARNYEAEAKWKQIITVAAILFIFVSCIGLLGLVILSIEQRTKEIGIRKVLGAAVSRIVMLISKDFIFLISIAFLIGVPIAYYAIHQWLQNFAYRIDINWWMFALAGVGILLIVLITLSFQAIRAAMANPVKSLKTE